MRVVVVGATGNVGTSLLGALAGTENRATPAKDDGAVRVLLTP